MLIWLKTINMQGITVICSKRGGHTHVSNHCEWLLTVPNKPDAVDFCFIPITSLLKGAPGRGFLSHAINLYLRCKYFIFPSCENGKWNTKQWQQNLDQSSSTT